MRYLIVSIFLVLGLGGISQNLSAKLNITITDTVKPYFLDIYFHKGATLVKKMTVGSSGIYSIKDLGDGVYNIEFNSPEAATRRLYLTNIHFSKDSVNELSITYPAPCKFIYSDNYKPVCTSNHSNSIVPILYGFPDSRAMKRAKKGLIHLGGCIITSCDPKFYCNIHQIEL